MNKLGLASITLFLLVFNCSAKVLNLSPDELVKSQNHGTVVIDIRTPNEWQESGIIPGAKRIMFFDEKRQPQINNFMLAFEELVKNKEQPFVLVCRSGSRTGMVTAFLDKNLGYKNGAHLKHGMNQWLKENRKIER